MVLRAKTKLCRAGPERDRLYYLGWITPSPIDITFTLTSSFHTL